MKAVEKQILGTGPIPLLGGCEGGRAFDFIEPTVSEKCHLKNREEKKHGGLITSQSMGSILSGLRWGVVPHLHLYTSPATLDGSPAKSTASR
jgi:hypothetical protein